MLPLPGGPVVGSILFWAFALCLAIELVSEAGEHCLNARFFALGERLLKIGRLAHSPWLLLPGKFGVAMWTAESNQIQFALTEQQKYAEALFVSQCNLRLVRKRYGENSVRYIEELVNRSFVLSRMGNAKEAEEVAEEALFLINSKEMRSESESHVLCLTLNNLGVVAIHQGRIDEASNYFDKALQLNRAFLTPNNTSLVVSYCNIGYTLTKAHQYVQAEKACRTALEMAGNSRAHAPIKATIMNNLGDALRGQGKLAEAEKIIVEALATRRKLHKANHPYLAYSYHNLGKLRLEQNRLLESEECFRLAMNIREKHPGADHSELKETLGEYQLILRKLDREHEAEGIVEAHNLSA